jgi:hypothetical protein
MGPSIPEYWHSYKAIYGSIEPSTPDHNNGLAEDYIEAYYDGLIGCSIPDDR